MMPEVNLLKLKEGIRELDLSLWKSYLDLDSVLISNREVRIGVNDRVVADFLMNGQGDCKSRIEAMAHKLGIDFSMLIFYDTGKRIDPATNILPIRATTSLVSGEHQSTARITNSEVLRPRVVSPTLDDLKRRAIGEYLDPENTLDKLVLYGGLKNVRALLGQLSGGTASGGILISGPSGVGKTHLLNGALIDILKDSSGKVCFVPANTFQLDYTTRSRAGCSDTINSGARQKIKFFGLDDFHLIRSSAVGTMRSLCDTLDHLRMNHIPFALTSNLTLDDLIAGYFSGAETTEEKTNAERLSARLSRLLYSQVSLPNLEEAGGLVKELISKYGLSVSDPDEVARVIVSCTQKRGLLPSSLHGKVIQIVSTKSLDGVGIITPEITYSILGRAIEVDPNQPFFNGYGKRLPKIAIGAIMRYVCEKTGVSIDALTGKGRPAPIARARKMVYVLGVDADWSYTDVGMALSRGHSVVTTEYSKTMRDVAKEAELPEDQRRYTRFLTEAKIALGMEKPKAKT
jgi:chromosomal replication initiation ATPase DnaA